MSSFSDFELEFLATHNEYRRQHGSPPLQLNRDICNYAQEWAQHLANMNSLQHRSNNRYGENLYSASGMQVGARDAVKAWYDEISYYNFNRAAFCMNTGHFTQVVWKGSQQLGVGVAQRGNSTWVVANYDPPGNFTGRFTENVLPRCC